MNYWIDDLQSDSKQASVFEKLFELIERHRFKYKSKFELGDLYEIITSLDKAVRDFNIQKENEMNLVIYNKILEGTFSIFIQIFKTNGFTDSAIFYAFKRYITYFTLVLKVAGQIKNSKSIFSNFYDNFPSLRIDKGFIEFSEGENEKTEIDARYLRTGDLVNFIRDFPKEIDIDKRYTEGEVKSIILLCNDFIQRSIYWSKKSSEFRISSETYYLEIELEVADRYDRASNMFQSIWLITTALDNVENAKVQLTEIEKGSIKAKMRVLMKDTLAQEEVKTVLQVGMESAVKLLTGGTVSYTEIRKQRLEEQQLKIGNKIAQHQLDTMPNDVEVKLERALDLESKMLDNEKKKIENTSAKIELISKLSELVTKGIIEADMIRISVDDILRIFKEDDTIREIGPEINS